MRRFNSIRSRLVMVMILPALVAVGIAFLLYIYVDQGVERSLDQQSAQDAANGLARLLASGHSLPEAAALQAALPHDQVLVTVNGRTTLTGPPPIDAARRPFELSAASTFPGGGIVTVRDYNPPGEATPYELIVVAAIPVILLVVSAVAAISYLSQALRRQIDQASLAAERVAGGDFSARMGSEGRGEFGSLARAFDAMAARLDTSDRNQRQFLGDLAHEIATPVTTISGSGLALGDGTATTDEERFAAVQTLTRETRRLQGLLADLHSLTRLDLAETVQQAPVAIDDLCREIMDRFMPVARAAGVHLSLRTSDVTTVSDRRLLDMVVANFVSNAIRYTPAGGSVRIDTRRDRQEVVIAVRDSGIGISAEHQARIFDRFYRVDEARQRATGGSGLGLSLAMRAAKELRGWIEVQSEPGIGSTFRLSVPIRPATAGSHR
jgi:two-component system sensor histidine kinase BaeS